MAHGGDVQHPAATAPGVGELPDPRRLSVYTFHGRYHALNAPLWIGLAVVALICLHVLLMWLYHSQRHLPEDERIRWYFVSVFDLGEEESFGTWLSAVLLLFIGRILWGRAKAVRQRGEVWAWWWFLAAIVFHVLSIEEVLDAHETLQEWYRRQDLEEGPRTRMTLAWTAGFVGAAMVPLLFRVDKRFAAIMLISGGLYVLGAVGIDQFAGTDTIEDYDDEYLWVALAEGLEMLAAVLFLHGLLAWLAGDTRGTVTEQTEIRR